MIVSTPHVTVTETPRADGGFNVYVVIEGNFRTAPFMNVDMRSATADHAAVIAELTKD